MHRLVNIQNKQESRNQGMQIVKSKSLHVVVKAVHISGALTFEGTLVK